MKNNIAQKLPPTTHQNAGRFNTVLGGWRWVAVTKTCSVDDGLQRGLERRGWRPCSLGITWNFSYRIRHGWIPTPITAKMKIHYKHKRRPKRPKPIPVVTLDAVRNTDNPNHFSARAALWYNVTMGVSVFVVRSLWKHDYDLTTQWKYSPWDLNIVNDICNLRDAQLIDKDYKIKHSSDLHVAEDHGDPQCLAGIAQFLYCALKSPVSVPFTVNLEQFMVTKVTAREVTVARNYLQLTEVDPLIPKHALRKLVQHPYWTLSTNLLNSLEHLWEVIRH